ncbi:MAG: YfhO family protein [Candidatus Woesebacteria bacterium]|nr:YfhO family protein [Candidatus Woesebacteria bacterium]
MVALTLSLISLRLLSRKRKEVLFLVLLLVLSLIISYPTPVSVFLWKHNLLGMGSSSSHRALVLFNLAAALLAGFGYDLIKLKIKLGSKLICIFIPFLILLGFFLYAYKIHSIVGLRNLVLPAAVLIFSSFILLLKPKFRLVFILLSIIELFYFGWKFIPFSSRDLVFPKTPVLEFLAGQPKPFRIIGSSVIPVNLTMPYGFESLEGYETMRPALISQLIASINSGSGSATPAGRYGIIDNVTSPLLDLVNTKYYLSLKKDLEKYDSKRFKIAFEDKSVVVLENLTALPRNFVVNKWEIEKDNKKILEKLLDPKFPFSEKIILEEDPGDVEKMYFISDAYYPGWKAYADGKEVKIYRANYAFRAVSVPSSDTEVIFKYESKSFFNGLKISAVLSIVTILGMLYFSLKIRK